MDPLSTARDKMLYRQTSTATNRKAANITKVQGDPCTDDPRTADELIQSVTGKCDGTKFDHPYWATVRQVNYECLVAQYGKEKADEILRYRHCRQRLTNEDDQNGNG